MEEGSSISKCDLCGRADELTGYTIYSARAAGPSLTSSQTVENMPAHVIVTTSKPYHDFFTHQYLICKRCKVPTLIMTAFGILLLVSLAVVGVLAIVNKESVTGEQVLGAFGAYLLMIFGSVILGPFVMPDKRLKRKALGSRGSRAEFGAWTEREFRQAFGKLKPD